jgi:hypothetical protein
VAASVWSRPRCDHRGGRCKMIDVRAQFTASLKEATEDNRQPKFFCALHSGLYPNVSPTTGREVTNGTKP